MNITELLSQFQFPNSLRQELQSFCNELLPLQQQVIQDKTLFTEKNLLIHAPTSAGKTFLAELAMLNTSFQHGKSVYLVPLRVQAEEIFRTLRQRYKKYGLQILISTSDYRHHDPLLEQGKFHIAIVVYEKMFQLIARQPTILDKIQLMVFDDIDLIFDPERGTTVDFLLTRCFGTPIRCLALSACLPKPHQIAEWMNAKLVHSYNRPVPLRKGVLYNGIFYYQNEDSEMKEEPLSTDCALDTSPLIQTVNEFIRRGETCLIFLKTRNEVRSLAYELSEYLHLPPAEQAIEQIKQIEPTHARDALLHAFQHGIGFHYSDLLPEERQIVEQAFRNGELRLLVATSTLAKGLNLPVNNVFISHEKWYYADKKGTGTSLPLSLSEYENMAGRAGRYGLTDQPARAILIASTEEEKQLLFHWYIQQNYPFPSLTSDIPAIIPPMLSVIASYETVTMEHIENFLKSSWLGKQPSPANSEPHSFSHQAKEFIDTSVRNGFCMMKTLHRYGLTPRGEIIATKGVSPETIEQLEQWLNIVRGRKRDELDTLFTASLTPDGWLPQFEFSYPEYQSQTYLQLLLQTPLRTPWDVVTPLQKFHQKLAEPDFYEAKGVKIAFVLREWIHGKPLSEIEEEFAVSAGQIVQAGARIGWIVDVIGQLAQLMSINNPDEFRTLSDRVRYGLPEEGLSLARNYEGLLTRSQILSLISAGINTPEQILKTPASILAKHIPETLIGELKRHSQKIKYRSFKFNRVPSITSFKDKKLQPPQKPPEEKSHISDLPCSPSTITSLSQETAPISSSKTTAKHYTKESADYLLALDTRRPGEIWVEGKKIRLPEKQYRLLCLLAKNVGYCVSYETVYKELWNDIIVEDAQMAFQKCMLLRKLCEVSDRWKGYLRTIPKRGFILDLPPQKIRMT